MIYHGTQFLYTCVANLGLYFAKYTTSSSLYMQKKQNKLVTSYAGING